MKIRLLVFLQHGRHETIDISHVVSPRIASASACYRSALFEICDLRGERRLEAVTAAECLETGLIPPAAEIGTLRLSKRSARRQVDAVEAVHMPNAGADAVADSRLVPVSFALGGAE
jgi:hypothetical protein